MKLNDKVSWLMETVQQSLFPHLDECLLSPLTEPEKRLVKILELVQIESHVPVSAKRQWLGRPLQEREAIARAFVAKAVLRYQHTSSLRHELLSTPNMRMICGFTRRQDVPSESTFSRAFTECAKADLGALVHDALVEEYMSTELIGHVSRDSTAIVGPFGLSAFRPFGLSAFRGRTKPTPCLYTKNIPKKCLFRFYRLIFGPKNRPINTFGLP